MSDRTFSQSSFLRDLRADRETPCEVREERLRTMAGLRGTAAPALSAWRGRSGRRYVVGVVEIAQASADEFSETVVLAISRDEAGLGHIIRATADTDPTSIEIWLAVARRAGAVEIHIHRLGETTAARTAVVIDLTEGHDVVGLAA